MSRRNLTCSVPLSVAVRDFLNSRRLANLSPRTIAWYEEKLGTFLAGLEDTPLEYLTIQLFRARVAERATQVKPTTVNHHIRAFKAFVNWLVDEEEYEVPINPRKIKPLTIEKRLPPALTSDQIATILAQPDLSTWPGQRDYCMISLLADTGIRIAECLTATMKALDEGEGTLTVIGKGNKQRTVAMSLQMRKAMRKWLRLRARVCQRMDWDCDLVFPSYSGERLTYPAVAKKIHAYGQKAGIEGVRISAHTFRSTFATHFCRQGGSIVHLQTILGHTTLEMSRRYAAVVDEDAFESSRRFSPLAAMKA